LGFETVDKSQQTEADTKEGNYRNCIYYAIIHYRIVCHLDLGLEPQMSSNPIFSSSLQLLGLGMIALGLALVGVTVWFWLASLPEPEVLASLEIMGDRKFVVSSDRAKDQMLESVRVKPLSKQLPKSTSN
jgi:hypothetical protein